MNDSDESVEMKKTKSVWSKLSTACLIGGAIFLVASVASFCFAPQFDPDRPPFSARLGIGFIMLFCAMAEGVCVFSSLDFDYALANKSGFLKTRFRKIDRKSHPLGFWVRVVFMGIAMVFTLIAGIMILLGYLEWN